MTEEHPKLGIQVSAAIYRQCMVQTQACLIRDLIEMGRINKFAIENGGPAFSLHYAHSANDALIGRCRSRIATMFLEHRSLPEVLMMVDGDVDWPSGAIQMLAQLCHREQAIVGAIVPKRSTGDGCAIAFGKEFNDEFREGRRVIRIGECGLVPDVEYVGSAFTAYPKVLFQRLIDEGIVKMVFQKFYPFFMETILKDYPEEGMWFHLSEDWYICDLARKVGVPVMAERGLVIGHHGEKRYTVEDAWGKEKQDNEDGKPTQNLSALRYSWETPSGSSDGDPVEGEVGEPSDRADLLNGRR